MQAEAQMELPGANACRRDTSGIGIPGRLRYTVMVPTKDRPQELLTCLASAAAQLPPPTELLVIDNGALDEAALRTSLGEAGRLLRVVRVSGCGLVELLDRGAAQVETPWFLVLDDDIRLEPDFMVRVSEALADEKEAGRLAAIAGYPMLAGRSWSLRWRVRVWLERLFLITGMREGHFLPSGFFTNYELGRCPSAPFEVEHIPGGLALWRTDIFREVRYDPWFEGYALGCDAELAYRCTRQWRALCVPAARAVHAKSTQSRIPNARMGRQKLRNQLYIFRKHFAHSPLNWLAFLWAITGQLLILVLGVLGGRNVRGRLAEIGGMLAAIPGAWRETGRGLKR
ncbi:MAG: glycosyltransferase family 2 protein [Candidatus Sumerlaeia bacterium]|nr:glycosyltransferase family 2 protein [Candidatus Sumerlaeia bacterium]